VIGNSIRFGLEAVKGVGSAAIDAIIEIRADGIFLSLTDFCSRADSRRVNKKVMESLIKAGSMDSMGRRAQLISALPSIMETSMRLQKERTSGQESMFGMQEPIPERLPDVAEWDDKTLLAMEKEALGFYITGHPLNAYKEKLNSLSVTFTRDIQELKDRQNILLGGMVMDMKKIQTKRTGDLMAYVIIEDLYGTVEVIVFPDVYKEAHEIIAQDLPVVISGTVDKTDKGLKIISNKIVSIDNSDELLNYKVPERKGGSNFGRQPRKEEPPVREKQKFVTLTVYSDKKSMLPKLDEVLSKHKGDSPVFLKIVSPNKWETVLKTGRQVMPTAEMLSEAESVLGKGRATVH
jgi:DNA polymerase-3 subunit alpha